MRISASMLCGIAIVLGLGMAGCSESENVTLHEPGVYKGTVDPIVEKQGSAEQQERLVQRFNMVQTDR